MEIILLSVLGYPTFFTSIRRGRACSDFGSVIVSTPFLSVAYPGGVDGSGQAGHAGEGAGFPFAAKTGDAFLFFRLPFALERELVSGHGDVDLFDLDPRQLGFDPNVLPVIPDVEGGIGRRQVALGRPAVSEEVPDEIVHLPAKNPQTTRYQRVEHRSPPVYFFHILPEAALQAVCQSRLLENTLRP
jgi:hypothetical protein